MHWVHLSDTFTIFCYFCDTTCRFAEGMTMFNKFVENKVEFFRMVDQLEFPGDILEPVAALVSND